MSHIKMSSRQRLLAALRFQPVDYAPCSFMLFKGLWNKCGNYLEFIQKQLDLGLDTFVQIPPRQPGQMSDSYNLHGLPVHYSPDVIIHEWKEEFQNEGLPVLIKEYKTPAGILRAEVNRDAEWPYGNHVPFLDDYVETRARKFIIEGHNDLEALQYLLVSPCSQDISCFKADSDPVLEFAHQRDLLVAGGWGVGGDLIGWVYGLQKMIYAVHDQPDFIHDLLNLVDGWNRSRMKVVLEAGVDLYIKRAWYENCDFWSPRDWRKFIFPILKSDAELAHEHGALFGYFITSSCMPLLDMIAEAGVDVIIGVDPARWNLKVAREKLAGKVCLWGGVNGHLTIEQGSVDLVKAEIQEALKIPGNAGGFILSPVDNVRDLNNVSQSNVEALIQEWHRLRSND
jgi:hypothetical protein